MLAGDACSWAEGGVRLRHRRRVLSVGSERQDRYRPDDSFRGEALASAARGGRVLRRATESHRRVGRPINAIVGPAARHVLPWAAAAKESTDVADAQVGNDRQANPSCPHDVHVSCLLSRVHPCGRPCATPLFDVRSEPVRGVSAIRLLARNAKIKMFRLFELAHAQLDGTTDQMVRDLIGHEGRERVVDRAHARESVRKVRAQVANEVQPEARPRFAGLRRLPLVSTHHLDTSVDARGLELDEPSWPPVDDREDVEPPGRAD
jgi:hypothetical protein